MLSLEIIRNTWSALEHFFFMYKWYGKAMQIWIHDLIKPNMILKNALFLGLD